MKRVLVSSLLLIKALSVDAAFQNFRVTNRIPRFVDGHKSYFYRNDNYHFRVELLSDNEGYKQESRKEGRPFVMAKPGEQYAVRLHNPLPVRVGVNLTVDGLNTITGKPSGISDGAKWIIEPYSSVVIRGWQINQGELRRFFFTEKPKSYAAWRGEALHKDLSKNCGAVGAAYFWSKDELAQYFENNPIVINSPPKPFSQGMKGKTDAMDSRSEVRHSVVENEAALSRLKAQSEEFQAGTGMGQKESHLTTLVDFHYDTGMYNLSQAILIYYDFERKATPNPFPDISYAPEMRD